MGARRRDVAGWAEKCLSGELSLESFLMLVPEEQDEDVAELVDLIEHLPRRGGIFGASPEQHEVYVQRIRQLIQQLRGDDSSGAG